MRSNLLYVLAPEGKRCTRSLTPISEIHGGDILWRRPKAKLTSNGRHWPWTLIILDVVTRLGTRST